MLTTTLWRATGIDIQVSQAYLGLEAGAINVAQTVPLPTQSVTMDQGTAAQKISISWAEWSIPGASVVRTVTASQTVPLPTQAVTVDTGAAKSVQVSWAVLNVPDTAAATLSITAAQTVPLPTQSAAMYDIVGQINGGGTITEGLPHRSLTVAQTVPLPALSAAMGAVGTLGPLLLTVTQTVPLPTQVAVGDAQKTLTANQVVPLPSLVARIVDPNRLPPPLPPVTPGTESGGRGNKYRTRRGGKTITADTWDELAAAVRALDEADAPAVDATPAVRVEAMPLDPAEQTRREMAAQREQFYGLLQQMQALTEQDRATIVQQYESRIQNAETTVQAALALAQRAKDDADALAALLTS